MIVLCEATASHYQLTFLLVMSNTITFDYRRSKNTAKMDPSAPPNYFELDNSSFTATKRSFGGNGAAWIDGRKVDVRLTFKGDFDLSSENAFNRSRFNAVVYSFKSGGGMTISGFNSRVEDADSAFESMFEADNKIYGSKFNDKLVGDDGDDIIYGGKGDDKIKGGEGDDLIHGGSWKKKGNQVWGNSGRDTFVIDDGAYGTVIQDFDVNKDRIGLSRLRDWSNKYSWETRGKNTYIYDGEYWQAKLKGRHDLSLANIVEI